MPDYSKAKIYTIRCRSNPEHIYIGSTINHLYKRLGQHKTKSKTNPNYLLYSTINNDWTNWYIELYENYPCDTKEQLLKREGEVIREIGTTLNMRIAGRGDKEYYKDNCDKKKEQIKEWQQENLDKVREYQKEWQLKNIDKLKQYKKEWYEKKKLEKQAIKNITL